MIILEQIPRMDSPSPYTLMTTYPRAVVMGGDRNYLNLAPLLAAVPRLLNIQPLPTHARKNLNVLLSTMHHAPVLRPTFF